MNGVPSCSGDSVLNCIFAKIDDDRNGLITLPEFMLFAVRDLKLYSLDGDSIRDKFYNIDTDGNGGLDYSEFCEFLELHVVGTADDETSRRRGRGGGGGANGQTVVLGLERALHVYAKQQIKAHQTNHKSKDPSVCPTQLPPDGGSLLEHHNLTVEILADSINADAKEILDFWFPDSMEDAMTLWFGKSPQLDENIRRRFGDLVESAAEGELDAWTADPIECLALVILLDQFPRNIYRHQKQMYATDEKAQAVCTKALYNNYHRYITPLQAIFMPCLVLTHSELFQHQELCVDIWCHFIQNTLPQDDPLRIFEMIFLKHLKVVAKFGRFPHRNEILERDSTYEEDDFLNDKSFRFDLPLHYSKDGKVSFKDFGDKSAFDEEEEENEDEDDEEDVDESHQAAMGMIQTLNFWKKTLEERFPEVDIVIQKRSGGIPAMQDNSNLPSPREPGRIGSSSPSIPGGRRGSRVAALEAELKDHRRTSGSNNNGNNGKGRHNNVNNNGSSLLSAQQQRSLLDEDTRGGRSGGGNNSCGGGGGGGGGVRRMEEGKGGKPPVSLNREKMSTSDLEKRLAGDLMRQNNRRASLAQSLGNKEEQQPQQQQQQQQQRQKRSKSKGRDSFMGPQGSTCFDRRF